MHVISRIAWEDRCWVQIRLSTGHSTAPEIIGRFLSHERQFLRAQPTVVAIWFSQTFRSSLLNYTYNRSGAGFSLSTANRREESFVSFRRSQVLSLVCLSIHSRGLLEFQRRKPQLLLAMFPFAFHHRVLLIFYLTHVFHSTGCTVLIATSPS